ncbi:MAG: hypothetical protein V2A76_08390 [Planctomycetota bacterium]
MRLTHWVLMGGTALLLSGALFAIQQGTRFPGERQATTSLMLDMEEGDELILSYNTIQFGPQFAATLASAPEEQWPQLAGWVLQRLNAKLVSDVALMVGDTRLEAGTYGLTFLPNKEAGVTIQFLSGQASAAEAPLKMNKDGEEFKFLSLNLRSAGSDDVVLSMDYGTLKGRLDLSVVEDEEE